MNLELLDIKNKLLFDTITNKNCIITNIVDYSRTLQYKIYISYGYGLNETKKEIMVLKKEIHSFFKRFIDQRKIKFINPESLKKNSMEEEVKISSKEILNQRIMENSQPSNVVLAETKNSNYYDMQCILLDTLKGLKDGSIKQDQAKSISNVAQVLINSIKVEGEIIRNKGSKPKMLFQ